MGKGPDRTKRRRRSMTDQEKANRAAAKAKEVQEKNQKAKSKFLQGMSAPNKTTTLPVPVPTTDGPTATNYDSVSEKTNQGGGQGGACGASSNEAETEGFQMLRDHQCNGTDSLPEIRATMDEDDGGDGLREEGQVDGVMKRYMSAIQSRLQREISSADDRDTWLLEYLEAHEYWIRAESSKWICSRLRIQQFVDEERHYYRDVRVWFPDLEGGTASCMPKCCSCKRNSFVRVHSYPKDHPGRRIASFDSCFYIMSRQYLCKQCQQENESRKEAANLSGTTHKRLQYTFMGDHEEVLKRLPHDLSYKFPAILTHRYGIDKKLAASLRPFMDKGFRAEGIAEWLLELHSIRYFEDYIAHELCLEKKLSFSPVQRTMFSSFTDPKKYAASMPTHKYLESIYQKEHDRYRPALDREQRFVECGDQMAVDGHCKTPRKLTRVGGDPIFQVLQSFVNKIGQIRMQTMAATDSHEQLNPTLEAFQETNRQHGRADPALIFTDNPTRDCSFFLDKFPRLRETQQRLDKFAADRNRARKRLAGGVNSTRDLSSSSEDPQDLIEADSSQGVKYQLAAPGSISDKLRALRDLKQEEYDNLQDGERIVYSLDGEWYTVFNVYSGQRRSTGKMSLLQIGYHSGAGDRASNPEALLLQLPRGGGAISLPDELIDFLEDDKHVFVGVRVKNDIDKLRTDFSTPRRTLSSVHFTELGRYAADRDVVQNAGTGLADLVKVTLGETLSKDDDVRCSNWSASNLTEEQKTYAALDAIKSLEVYNKLLSFPDLSQRLDPGSLSAGLQVDIVPPHARGNRHKASPGYFVGDLRTRGAIGVLLGESQLVSNPSRITPNHCKSDKDGGTVVVRVTKVLAPGLLVPHHTIRLDGEQSRKACLGDFGAAPFELVLPLTALRNHLDSATVRTYVANRPLDVRASTRRYTPPSKSQSTGINKELEDLLNSDKKDDLEDSIDNDDGAVKVDDDGTKGELSAELAELTGDDDDDLGSDARDEQLQQHLESIRESKLRAEVADLHQRIELLYSEELGDVPSSIDDRFSAVLGDTFHAMDRPKLPVRHEYKKAYFVALMNAFFAWDKERMDTVKKRLLAKGWTSKQIESRLYFKPQFFRRRVERIVLPPRQLYLRVRAVYVTFGKKIDSKTGRPLFNKRAWVKAKTILKEILRGFYSDPPGFNFYTVELDGDGKLKMDSYGLAILRCSRGTNLVESIHRQFVTAFRYVAGVQLGDALLAERRHRHNVKVAERNYRDYPRVGHFNTWLVDKLQLLVEKNHGIALFPGWRSSSDYVDTDESSITVPVHSQDLHDKIEARAKEIGAEKPLETYLSDMKFLCRAWGLSIPFRPVDGYHEFKLFSAIMLNHLDNFDAEKMSLLWVDSVDGIDIFPKLPAHLRIYHKKWERNQRIAAAVKRMRSEQAALDTLNKQVFPEDLGNAGQNNNDDTTSECLVGAAAEDEGPPVLVEHATFRNDASLGATIFFPRATLPLATLPLPGIHALRGPSAGYVRVGLDRISDGLPCPQERFPVKRGVGKRGRDNPCRKRQKKRCFRCARHGNKGDSSFDATKCPGSGARKYCIHFQDDRGTRSLKLN